MPAAGGAVVAIEDVGFEGLALPPRSSPRDQQLQLSARASSPPSAAPSQSQQAHPYAVDRAAFDIVGSSVGAATLPAQTAGAADRARTTSGTQLRPHGDIGSVRSTPSPSYDGVRRTPPGLPHTNSAGSAAWPGGGLLRPPSQPQVLGGRRTPRGTPAVTPTMLEQLDGSRRGSPAVSTPSPSSMKRISSLSGTMRAATVEHAARASSPRLVAQALPWRESNGLEGGHLVQPQASQPSARSLSPRQ